MTIIRPKSGEIDLTTAAEPIANADDAILRRIVEGVAYHYEDPAIRAVSAPLLESDRLAAAARELLRRANEASRAARASAPSATPSTMPSSSRPTASPRSG